MTFLGELRVQARQENLRLIAHFVQGIGQRLALSDRALFDLDLAIEEAATNIIRHAYPGERKGHLLISASETGDFVQVTLTDWGVPLDPSKVKPFDINAPIEARIKGGMGLHFIHALMDSVERTTSTELGQPNTLKLVKLIERAGAGGSAMSPVQELNAMRSVSEVMTSNIKLDDLLNLILNKLVTTINAERGTLYLVDEERGELWSRVLLQDTGSLSEIRLKMGEGIAGHVAATGAVLNIPDAYADPRFNPQFDKISGFQTRTILTAPMLNPQQKVIGVVQLLNKKEGVFTFRDERLLTAMAAQAAISIENARLYQQEIRQQLINRELETAHSIQASFLPDRIPALAGWDIGALWCPIRSVAGDFYDFHALADGRLGMVIADVSGKGIPAALFMALSVTVLRYGMSIALPPDEVLRHANEMIISEQRSRMFATTFVGYLAPASGEMLFACGGHNPALWYHAATGAVDYVTAQGVAIGIFKEAEFIPDRLRLEPGDIFVLYTDGITEVLNSEEEEFGEDRLEALVRQHTALPAQELADRILETINDFAAEQELSDDATLVIVKRTGSAR
ncbi:MAG: SpoIIE family protein phosphatase [Anaerolineae bacterium]|nr:SpoIIE family protein phosphatase [Anaerolineae bacterium]